MSSSPSSTASSLPSYRGLYGGLALVVAALSGGQLYADYEDENLSIDYPTLWEMLGSRYGAGLALASLTLIGVLVLLAAIASVRPITPVGIPITIALIGIAGAVMLISRVGAGSRHVPELDTAGAMMLMTCWAAVALGVIHAIHLIVVRLSDR
ncbi:hypothetical protein [Pseudactinotalea sp.]|uniref:hypothetical protein n=1 Tax=Pseudactinotalea sp. TaxID=1926260 RepID=UPI003B3AE66A